MKKQRSIKKYRELWDGIKNKIEIINDGDYNFVECKCQKSFTKTRFNTNDDLPLNKPFNLNMLTIIVISVYEDQGKSYPQVSLDECLYEL